MQSIRLSDEQVVEGPTGRIDQARTDWEDTNRESPVDRSSPETGSQKVGLLAIGTCGAWEVSIDETIGGRERWFAQIESPSIYLYFEVASLDILGKTVGFLMSRPGQGLLRISRSKGTPVSLVRDDEYPDRCFFVVGPTASPVVRLSLTGSDVRELVSALQQVVEEVPVSAALDAENNPPRRR
jgi:hypothetical protein